MTHQPEVKCFKADMERASDARPTAFFPLDLAFYVFENDDTHAIDQCVTASELARRGGLPGKRMMNGIVLFF